MKRLIFCVLCISWLAISAIAATGVSPEFKVDLSGMGPWDVRTAALTEKILYSTAWATNLTAAQQGEAKAVVKVNPCLKTPPKYLVVDMSGGRSAARWPVSYLDEVPSGGWTDEYKTEKLVLRYIPAGSFIMGGRATDYPGAVNTNLHMVTLTKPFYIGVFECTQRQWELAMGTRPSFFTNGECYKTRPVEQVTYKAIRGDKLGLKWPQDLRVDETSFMGILRRKAVASSFDLPTEAQWEYACRAGESTALNSGKDITSIIDDPEMDVLGRYHGNHGENITSESAVDCGTAIVGSYLSNKCGLFDMHGNVWEMCLDHWGNHTEGIDPKGGEEAQIVLKGGCWRSGVAASFTSACFSAAIGGFLEDSVDAGVGFRICLHDATVYPSADSATVLVNASGASAADWTPTRAGTYQLTHEVQVDGVTVAPMESALFKVKGPELKIVPMGELTNGVAVKVEKVGEGGEWTVYYSLDESEPTAGSTKYEGPFALEASATVKAMAISAGGVSSEVASRELALHPALAVEDTKTRQRYPWNGKVDIDCEVKGAENEDYLVSLVARDLDGGTNLPLRTAWQAGGTVTNNAFLVKPGAHRFTWDAAADITNDCEFAKVVVNVAAEHSVIIAAKKVLTLEVAGYAGAETLTNVPVLVRLSTAIDGFSYADFVDAKGGDLIFTDESGSVVYPHEIDEWHTDGESLVWVKLPRMVNGTKFKMAYGNSKLITLNSQLATHEVWRDYAGVWHMNEDSGTAFDSTAHGLDALPSCGTNGTAATLAQMVAHENGACGKARVNATQHISAGNYMCVPSYSALGITDKFVVSGWFHTTVFWGADLMIGRMYNNTVNGHGYSSKGGWHIETWSRPEGFVVCGSTNHTGYVIAQCSDMQEDWVSLAIVYSGSVAKCYANGELVNTGTIVNPTDNGLPLTFGCTSNAAGGSYAGQYDEIRLRGGSLSADRIKADYDMIVNRNFLRYGPVENGNGAAE